MQAGGHPQFQTKHRYLTAGAILLVLVSSVRIAAAWHFVDVTASSGLQAEHGYVDFFAGTMVRSVAGGVATGDFDRDGWLDVYVECGDLAPNVLYRNRGDGTFEDVGDQAGVALRSFVGSGPLFFDCDGDGWLDLFVGGIEGQHPVLFHNDANGRFTDITATSGLMGLTNTVTATAGDYDGDGRLDLFLSHWGAMTSEGYLWHNQGNGRFRCVDSEAGIPWLGRDMDFSFTANFSDLDNDRDPDLLVTVDFGLSGVWLNDGSGHFTALETSVFSDENGMGGTVGDYDNDGDLDWFVTSIWDGDGVTEGDWGISGNRLYSNLGDGVFSDVTDAAGVREGGWGWGGSFADLNNDGHLDLVHVNGWPRGADQFHADPSRLFVSDGHGGFADQALALGFADTIQGRGVSCFDFDRDGDLDILVANNSGPLRLWRNDGGNRSNYLTVKPTGTATGSTAVGTRIYVQTGHTTQLRELSCGSNYVSQDALEAHFGLGAANSVDAVRVFWPDGSITSRFDVAANQVLVVDKSEALEAPSETEPLVIFPNPFRGHTSIALEMSRGGSRTIQVYNVGGRLVRTLQPASLQADTGLFTWDGRDVNGARLPSGIYFVRGDDNIARQATRLVLLR